MCSRWRDGSELILRGAVVGKITGLQRVERRALAEG